MAWRIEFTPDAERQLLRLDPTIRQRIQRFLSERVVNGDPIVLSKRLTSDEVADNLRSFRVGEYRVLVRIEKAVLTVVVVRVGPRGDVYQTHRRRR